MYIWYLFIDKTVSSLQFAGIPATESANRYFTTGLWLAYNVEKTAGARPKGSIIMKKPWIWKTLILICNGCAALAPVSWGYFMVRTRNTFQLGQFGTEQLGVCLTLTLVPLALFFLGQLAEHWKGSGWGNLLASVFFLLAAAGWAYTIAGQWHGWTVAVNTGAIGASCRSALRAAAATGAAASVLPLVYQIPGALRKKP